MYLTRMYPGVRSELFDIDGLRHVVKPDITAWAAGANRDPHELYPFDETVEDIHDASGAAFGIRQRWQTKRGEGADRRSVDVFTHDLEMGAFDNAGGDVVTNGILPLADRRTVWRAIT